MQGKSAPRHLLAVIDPEVKVVSFVEDEEVDHAIKRTLEQVYGFSPEDAPTNPEDEFLDGEGQPVPDNVIDVWEHPTVEGIRTVMKDLSPDLSLLYGGVWRTASEERGAGYTHRIYWVERAPIAGPVIKTFATTPDALKFHANSIKARGLVPIISKL